MAALDDQEIRVFICDRQPLVCAGLIAILDREPDISVTGAATSFDEAMSAVRQQRPAVAVIGHDPPKFDGIELSRKLSELGIDELIPMLLLEVASIDGSLARALQVGVRGVLSKDQAPTMLASTVRNIFSGAVVVAPPAATHLITQLAPTPESEFAATGRGDLSGRELEVFRFVARGLSNREIAEALSLSVATVKSHLYSLYRKLDLRDRIQVVILAYETGIIRPAPTSSYVKSK